MKINRCEISDLITSLALGGRYAKRLEVALGSRHFIWDGRIFVEGICTQDGFVDIPLATAIPNLYVVATLIEQTGVQPELFVVNGVGVGIVFKDVPQERSTPLITEK